MRSKLVFLKFIIVFLCSIIFNVNAFAVPINNIMVSGGGCNAGNWLGQQKYYKKFERDIALSQIRDFKPFYFNDNIWSMFGKFNSKNHYGFKFDVIEKAFGRDYSFNLNFNNYDCSICNVNKGATVKSRKFRLNDCPNGRRGVQESKKRYVRTFKCLDGVSESKNRGLQGSKNNNIDYAITGSDTENLDKQELKTKFDVECENDNSMAKETASVPEPATIILMGTGLLGVGNILRKKQLKLGKKYK